MGYIKAFITRSSQLHSFLCHTLLSKMFEHGDREAICRPMFFTFLPRDASAEHGNATVSRPSVCPSVYDV